MGTTGLLSTFQHRAIFTEFGLVSSLHVLHFIVVVLLFFFLTVYSHQQLKEVCLLLFCIVYLPLCSFLEYNHASRFVMRSCLCVLGDP